ncbi:MAG: tRNA (adenosine(37)-N6)-threonylcarbamoyltransferase complex ATPase subunit type 1 TsaE [Candidatus Paceibacterota bacterium]|jgi:tRNA threonylcarbamoyladenosine biosynthesis protein TsaE
MRIISKSLAETEKFAQDFLNKIKPKENDATVVGLHGDLGSGKTAFVKLIAKNLGITENITSPTFVIMKNYPLILQNFPTSKLPNFKTLTHIDAYRLDRGSDLAKLGFADLLNNQENLILLEWPEKVADVLPKDYVRIDFKFIDENTREISTDFWL